MNLRRWCAPVLAMALGLAVGACDTARTVGFANTKPVVLSLTVFPESIGPSDSAIVTCVATDADGDTLVYDWASDCRIEKKGAAGNFYLNHRFDRSLVVYAGTCVRAPIDTGWVSCSVRDRVGGGAYAGSVRIIVRQ